MFTQAQLLADDLRQVEAMVRRAQAQGRHVQRNVYHLSTGGYVMVGPHNELHCEVGRVKGSCPHCGYWNHPDSNVRDAGDGIVYCSNCGEIWDSGPSDTAS